LVAKARNQLSSQIAGAVVGLIAAFGCVHDIDLWVTDIANFVFYFVVAWLLLKAFGRSKTLDM